MNRPPSLRPSAFSLTELLVVMAIIAIMVPLSIPAISGMQRSMSVNAGGQMVSDTLITARQEASSKNRTVEVRVIETGSPAAYISVQNWIADDKGVLSPMGKIQTLPKGALISSDPQLSPILTANTDIDGTTNFGGLGTRNYVALRIRAGGLPDPTITPTNNFLTVHALSDGGLPPDNFFTIRLDSVTGRVTTHRP